MTEAEKKAAYLIQRERELRDIKNILSTPSGVSFFKRLFDHGKAFADPYTGNSQTFYNCGYQKFTREIFLDVVDVAPHLLKELIVREGGGLEGDSSPDKTEL